MIVEILVNSFSGGKTSAMMCKYMIDNHAHEYDQVINLFANTGQEHEQTLKFIKNCDEYFGFNTVWLEAVVNPQKGIGSGH